MSGTPQLTVTDKNTEDPPRGRSPGGTSSALAPLDRAVSPDPKYKTGSLSPAELQKKILDMVSDEGLKSLQATNKQTYRDVSPAAEDRKAKAAASPKDASKAV